MADLSELRKRCESLGPREAAELLGGLDPQTASSVLQALLRIPHVNPGERNKVGTNGGWGCDYPSPVPLSLLPPPHTHTPSVA